MIFNSFTDFSLRFNRVCCGGRRYFELHGGTCLLHFLFLSFLEELLLLRNPACSLASKTLPRMRKESAAEAEAAVTTAAR